MGASHISYDGQFDYLRRCMDSLLSQVSPTDVYVSISFESKYYTRNVRDMFQAYIKKGIKKIKLCKDQKYQMEHLHNLLDEAMKYDLITFCDDDDTYHSTRIAEFNCHYPQ